MSSDKKIESFCSYILNIPWLTVNITILNFAPLGDFLLSLEHSHSFMELLYVRSGKLLLQISNRQFHLTAGDLFYLNSKIPHTVFSEDDEPVVTYNISFLLISTEPTEKVPSEWIADEMLLVNAFFKNDFLYAHDIYGCEDALAQILLSVQSQRRGELVKIKNDLSNLIMSALQAFSKLAPHPQFYETLNGEFSYSATKILYYIRDHFTEGISLSSVAEALHYSPRQCQRIIQDVMGVSFSSFLLDLQLSYAKTLLCSSNATLEILSELAGFSSSRSLYRNFKEKEGISPQQYRQNLSRTQN